MATESKRGCGYRKVGNLYFVTDAEGYACDRMPIALTVCPCCGEGVKFSRSFTWIQPTKLFVGDHGDPEAGNGCTCDSFCPACFPTNIFGPEGKAGLMWVGKKYYSTESFMQETNELGFSKRINTIPNDFKVGRTWIFLAHVEAVDIKPNGKNDVPVQDKLFDREPADEKAPGIFMAVRPRRIERIVKQSEYELWQKVDSVRSNHIKTHGMEATDRNGKLIWKKYFELHIVDAMPPENRKIFERLDRDINRGITLVPVPDEDPDHAK